MESDTIRAVLAPTPAQQRALEATFEQFGRALRHAMHVGRRAGTTGNAVIHRLCYRELRQAYGLSANLAVRAIACAARALKDPGRSVDEADERAEAAIEYDARIFSIDPEAGRLSLSTVDGRLRDIPVRLEPAARRRLRTGRAIHARLVRVAPAAYRFTVVLEARTAS